jgi:hypothetical protein
METIDYILQEHGEKLDRILGLLDGKEGLMVRVDRMEKIEEARAVSDGTRRSLMVSLILMVAGLIINALWDRLSRH